MNRKPKLEADRIPYAVVSVDKLIEVAERIVALEHEMRALKKSMLDEDDVITIVIDNITPHVNEYRDGRLIVRAMEENGDVFKIPVALAGDAELDPDVRG